MAKRKLPNLKIIANGNGTAPARPGPRPTTRRRHPLSRWTDIPPHVKHAVKTLITTIAPPKKTNQRKR